MPSLNIGGAAKLESYFIYDGMTQIGTVGAETTTFTYSGVTSGLAYTITVSAVSLIGEGPKSNPLLIWAVDTPSAPSLSLLDTNRSSCTVSWSEVTPPMNSLITGYRLYVDDGLDGDYQLAYDGKDRPSVLMKTVEGLSSRLTYRLKVTALNKAGEGAESSSITCFTVTIPGQPGTP